MMMASVEVAALTWLANTMSSGAARIGPQCATTV